MTLKAVVDTIDAVPEAARSLYTEKEGKFHLAVEGLIPAAKLDEFRENNRSLFNENKTLKEQFDGIDPAVARKLITEAAKVRDKQLIEAGKVDELVVERTGNMKAEYEKTLKAERDAAAGLKSQLEGLLIDGAIRDAAGKAGVRPAAIEDVLLRGRGTFKLVDGKAVAMEGDKQLFGKTSDPLTIEEWVNALAEKASHLFEPSQGGGARGQGGGAAAGGTMTRKAFDALSPADRAAAIKAKKTIVD